MIDYFEPVNKILQGINKKYTNSIDQSLIHVCRKSSSRVYCTTWNLLSIQVVTAQHLQDVTGDVTASDDLETEKN